MVAGGKWKSSLGKKPTNDTIRIFPGIAVGPTPSQ